MAQLDRRTFVKRATQAVAGLGGLSAVATAGETSALRPCPASAWKKRGIVLRSAEESGRVQNFACPAEPLGDRRWRIWHSTYGIRWERPFRKPWISRGKPGEPDCYGIYAPHALVNHDDRWHLLYTGVNSAHNGKRAYGDLTAVVMHATCDSIWA